MTGLLFEQYQKFHKLQKVFLLRVIIYYINLTLKEMSMTFSNV